MWHYVYSALQILIIVKLLCYQYKGYEHKNLNSLHKNLNILHATEGVHYSLGPKVLSEGGFNPDRCLL